MSNKVWAAAVIRKCALEQRHTRELTQLIVKIMNLDEREVGDSVLYKLVVRRLEDKNLLGEGYGGNIRLRSYEVRFPNLCLVGKS